MLYRLRPSARHVPVLTSLCALCVGFGPAPSAKADAIVNKSDRFLQARQTAGPKTGWSSVIARLDGELNPERERAVRSLGADIYRRLPLIHCVALRVPSRSLARLVALPFVTHLSSDAVTQKSDEFTVGSSYAWVGWLWYGATGSGVNIAVVDSGIRMAPDLGNHVHGRHSAPPGGVRLAGAVSFVNDGNGTDDLCGHGTHVSGLAAGDGFSSTGPDCFRTFYGIAPAAGVVNVRVLDAQGKSDVSTVVAGIQWVVQNRDTYNIRVMNLSLGHPVGESYTTDPLCQAVEQAWKAGIVVVCAAGNTGRLNSSNTPGMDNEGWGTAYGSIECPGDDPYVITVGAMKSIDGWRGDDRVATYSGRGPSRLDFVLKPDIVAPGNRVISLNANQSFLDTWNGGTNDIPWSCYMHRKPKSDSVKYFRLSGTSMATPVVAGAAALLLDRDPTLTPDTVKARLMVSADKWSYPDGSGDPCTFGAGYLNIPAALSCTVSAAQYALSPTLTVDDQGNVYIDADHALWGSRAIWGTGITDLRAIWGTHAIWGSSTNILDASRAVWGTSVWSDRATWGTNASQADLSSIAVGGE